ncbi:MAG TPA: hypothetical protein DEP84_07950 [Chloroflexi bacterium]|nr:hypothetical protein [Chloroflexota bacterium]
MGLVTYQDTWLPLFYTTLVIPPVTVFVIEEPAEAFNDLLSAAESSLDFWDNPFDDKDWNNA